MLLWQGSIVEIEYWFFRVFSPYFIRKSLGTFKILIFGLWIFIPHPQLREEVRGLVSPTPFMEDCEVFIQRKKRFNFVKFSTTQKLCSKQTPYDYSQKLFLFQSIKHSCFGYILLPRFHIVIEKEAESCFDLYELIGVGFIFKKKIIKKYRIWETMHLSTNIWTN